MLENEKKENGYNPEDSGSENRENQIQSIDEQQEDIFAEEDVAIPEEVSSEKNGYYPGRVQPASSGRERLFQQGLCSFA